MSQQASDMPRFAQILGRYRTLIGVMAALGLLAGAVFAALNPPVFTSQALVQFPSWSCPGDAICGGPAFASDLPDYGGARLLQELPSGVQVKPLAGNVMLLTTTARTAAQAEAATAAAARSYLAYAEAMSYPGDQASAQILEPATTATGTPPLIRLRDDALLGALFGALIGVIAALAGGLATIDPPTLPSGYDIGEKRSRAGQETWRAGQQTRYVSTGLSLEQIALDYARVTRDSTLDRSSAETF